MRKLLGKLGTVAPLITCVAMFLFFSLITDTFLTGENLLNILRQNSALAIMAIGVTFVLFLITKGLSLRITRGTPIFDIPPMLEYVGTKSIPLLNTTNDAGEDVPWVEIPFISIVAVVLLVVALIVLRYTRFGRNVYAVGGNRQAAELSGVKVKRTLVACLCICSVTAGFSGIILIGRLGSAQAGASSASATAVTPGRKPRGRRWDG